ncbi:hypothetical protein L1049_014352 [Liquidambar formosana]|uniref:Trehalose 6-phosphate phosphatase n=1 Tax=Liquidambar formosana TaxID=63359 RepID=A0AAP0RQZ7_LIQFO
MGYQQLPSETMNMEAISKATFGDNGDANSGSYSSWLKEHPSALGSFDRMMSTAKGSKIVVFLDYDGTLAQIVDNPDIAFMTDAMRAAVHEVACCFPTAIISGRCRDKVHEFVKLNDVYYAGSHGMDIMTPVRSLKFRDHKHQTTSIDEKGNKVFLFQPAQDFLPTVQEIFRVLGEKTKCIKGAMVENNKFCISVHSRRVPEEDVAALEKLVTSVMEAFPEFRLTGGKEVMEIRPPIAWDKGLAVEYLLDTLGFDSSSDVHPIYIGDDVTDEDAFKAIKRFGQGYPIVVSSIPKETKASYSLRDPKEVMSFLLHLAQWKRS